MGWAGLTAWLTGYRLPPASPPSTSHRRHRRSHSSSSRHGFRAVSTKSAISGHWILRGFQKMAFLLKVGSTVKRSAGSGSSMLQAFRCTSSSKVEKAVQETKEGVYPRRMHSESFPAKIRIVMKSFNNQKNNLSSLAPYMHKIGLPESRSLYTVLRSPHIDKKSREQFSMHVKKVFVEKKAETHELAKKFFWLKRLRILGAQYEINISFKTRLDKKIGFSKGAGGLHWTVVPIQKGRQAQKKKGNN
uniref:Uncharacterized protein n=3 Tax=Avena sativa TaxID=4498 RepID=A0ACD5TMC2_AVESA